MIETELKEKLAERIYLHRNRFHNLFTCRYREFLPIVINYSKEIKDNLNTYQIENVLRSGDGVAITINENNKPYIIGYVKNVYNHTNNNYYLNDRRLTDKDIIKLDKYDTNKYLELKEYDNLGNFVVLYNKPFTYLNDYNVIEHYADELSEIVASRFSITMQSKISTIIKSDSNSVDGSLITSMLYNGYPYINVSKDFDIEDNLITFDNAKIVSNLTELKREYQNKISELNSFLGLNSLGVDKESGVSDSEANSNKSFKKANENIYLQARNTPLRLLKKHFNLEYDLYAEYSDSMISELSSIEKVELLK